MPPLLRRSFWYQSEVDVHHQLVEHRLIKRGNGWPHLLGQRCDEPDLRAIDRCLLIQFFGKDPTATGFRFES